MKVWVPIDLPDGHHVREVVVQNGSVRLLLEPIDTITRDHPWERHVPEPERERWEYEIISAIQLGEARVECEAAKLLCNQKGSEGWECFHVNPGAVWFKRLRLT